MVVPIFFIILLMNMGLSALERPRFFDFDQTKVTFLREKIDSEEWPYFEFYDTVKRHADGYADVSCPAVVTSTSFTTALPSLALVYFVSEDSTYLDTAISWMDCLATISWGPIPQQASSLTLSGFSVAFDWLYDEISTESTRKTNYINRIVTELQGYYECLEGEVCAEYWGWCVNYLHNLFGVYSGGVGTAILTLAEESEVDQTFLENARSKIYDYYSLLIEQSLTDGTQVEGFSYISYYVGNQIKYYQMEEVMMDEHRIRDSEYYRKLAIFRLYGSVNYWDVIKYSDCQYRDNQNQYIYSIATKVNSLYPKDAGLIFWAANKFSKRKAQPKDEGGGGIGYWGSGTTYVSLLDFDESITEVSVEEYGLPLYRFFDDIGMFISRDSWEEDDNTVLYFKVGPTYGRSAAEKIGGWTSMYPPDRGVLCHVHPDQGSVHMYYKGVQLLLEDEYIWVNRGMAHNSVTFDGRGQYGENDIGIKIFDRSLIRNEEGTCEMIHTYFDDEHQVEYLVGDLTRIYPLAIGLESYLRHFVYVKKKYLFVFDDIIVNDTLSTVDSISQHFNVDHEGSVTITVDSEAKFATHFHSNDRIGLRLFDVSGETLETTLHTGDYDLVSGPSEGFSSSMLNVTHELPVDYASTSVLFRTIIIPFDCFDLVNSSSCIDVTDDDLPTIQYKLYGENSRLTKVDFDDIQITIDVDNFLIKVNEDKEKEKEKKEKEEKEEEKKKKIAIAIASVVGGVSLIVLSVVVIGTILLCVLVCVRRKKSRDYELADSTWE